MTQEERLRQVSEISLKIKEIVQWASYIKSDANDQRTSQRTDMILEKAEEARSMITVLTEDAARGKTEQEVQA